LPFGKVKEVKGKSRLEVLKTEAIKEYFSQTKLAEEGLHTHYTEALQCYCKINKFNKGDPNTNYKSSLPKDTREAPMCANFFSDKSMGSVLSLSITAVIIAFNLVLKKVIIAAITWVGEDTYSERLASITNGVFIAQFFNAGLLLPLVNANLTEHPPAFITSILNGAYYDYSPEWYA
jgi:hypothetical protein